MASFALGSNDTPSSRNLSDLHPELQARCLALFTAYEAKYPDEPQPFLDSTYRNPRDQEALFLKVPKVTNARSGQSLHNYYPSLAFDVAFRKNGTIDWSSDNFTHLGCMAAEFDLNWGGSWLSFKDRPHFQPANGGTLYRWEDARAGKEPVWSEFASPTKSVA